MKLTKRDRLFEEAARDPEKREELLRRLVATRRWTLILAFGFLFVLVAICTAALVLLTIPIYGLMHPLGHFGQRMAKLGWAMVELFSDARRQHLLPLIFAAFSGPLVFVFGSFVRASLDDCLIKSLLILRGLQSRPPEGSGHPKAESGG